MNKSRIFSAVITLLWIGVLIITYAQPDFEITLPSKIITVAAIIIFTIYTTTGASKFTSIAGKILIAMSVLAFITQLIQEGPKLISIDTLLQTWTLVCGLLLEKLSPHQQMYPWMFLMIATKVELILIGSFIALRSNSEINHEVNSLLWWGIIPLMLIGVLFLLTKKRTFYRVVILFTTVYALFLSLIFIINAPFSTTSLVVVAVALWPMITERLIGYRAFIYSKSPSQNSRVL